MEEKKTKDSTTKKENIEKKKRVNKKQEPEKKEKKTTRTKKQPPKEEIIETSNVVEEPKEIVIEKQSGFNILEVIIIMFITLCFGGLLGSALTYAIANKESIITSIPKELNEFVNTYEDITHNYYEEIDKDKLLNAGIEGMLRFLGDKYSVYMDKDASEEFNEQVEGAYVGIGSEIQRLENGDTIISNPFAEGPAAVAEIGRAHV